MHCFEASTKIWPIKERFIIILFSEVIKLLPSTLCVPSFLIADLHQFREEFTNCVMPCTQMNANFGFPVLLNNFNEEVAEVSLQFHHLVEVQTTILAYR